MSPVDRCGSKPQNPRFQDRLVPSLPDGFAVHPVCLEILRVVTTG